jgi:hypothetical protein
MATSKERIAHGIANGYRSGLEDKVAEQLSAAGLPVEYETLTIHYTKPVKASRYRPDFVMPNGIIIETKGRFLTADRQKHKLIKDQHPLLDIRFVFSRSLTKLSKASKTSYAAWCEQYGFQYADKLIPKAWINEPNVRGRWVGINQARKQ